MPKLIQNSSLPGRFTPVCRLAIDKRPDLWGNIERQLELIPEARQDYFALSWGQLLDTHAPDISVEVTSIISASLKDCPREKRIDFFTRGIFHIFYSKPDIKPDELKKILSDAVENMSLPIPGFLPGYFLRFLKADYAEGCGQSEKFFLNALDAGALIKAEEGLKLHTPQGRQDLQKTLYIKGFFKDSGVVLAFEPEENSLYKFESNPEQNSYVVKFHFHYPYQIKLRDAILAREAAIRVQYSQSATLFTTNNAH